MKGFMEHYHVAFSTLQSEPYWWFLILSFMWRRNICSYFPSKYFFICIFHLCAYVVYFFLHLVIYSLFYKNIFRSSHPDVFLVKGVLKICSKFTEEHPCRSLISIKLQINLIEITLRRECSPINFVRVNLPTLMFGLPT